MTSDFVTATKTAIATWHGIAPPNALAEILAADLAKIIHDFEAVRGALAFEDEPAGFEAALLEASGLDL